MSCLFHDLSTLNVIYLGDYYPGRAPCPGQNGKRLQMALPSQPMPR